MKALLAGIMGIVTFLSLIAYAFGQTPAKPVAVPTIPDAMQKDFFKAYAEALDASMKAQQANDLAKVKNEALQAATSKIRTFCGPDNQPNTNKEGNLECQAMPKLGKPAEKKP